MSADTVAARLAEAREAQEFLAANPDIEAVQLVITDANGFARGKNVAREELPALFTSGRNVAGSILGLDATGEDVDGTGLVWDVGDADQCCRRDSHAGACRTRRARQTASP
jgi:glutamine synthetase